LVGATIEKKYFEVAVLAGVPFCPSNDGNPVFFSYVDPVPSPIV